MEESNHQSYISLLEEILTNAEGLKQSSTVLLKDELSNKRSQMQFQAIHSQYLLYICIEEVCKFFMVLSNYPNKLTSTNQLYKSREKHNEKIQFMIDYIKERNPNNDLIIQYSTPDMVKKLREFKEPNLYVDFKDGKIAHPISNRYIGALDIIVKIAINWVELGKCELESFRRNPVSYIK